MTYNNEQLEESNSAVVNSLTNKLTSAFNKESQQLYHTKYDYAYIDQAGQDKDFDIIFGRKKQDPVTLQQKLNTANIAKGKAADQWFRNGIEMT